MLPLESREQTASNIRGVAGRSRGADQWGRAMVGSERTEGPFPGQGEYEVGRQGQAEESNSHGSVEGCSRVLALPEGLLSRVLDFLDGRSLLRAGAVCRRLRRAVWDGPDSSSLQRWRRYGAGQETSLCMCFEASFPQSFSTTMFLCSRTVVVLSERCTVAAIQCYNGILGAPLDSTCSVGQIRSALLQWPFLHCSACACRLAGCARWCN